MEEAGMSSLCFGVFGVHCLYKILGLLYAFAFAQDVVPLHQMIIHMILAGLAAMLLYYYYVLYIRYPGSFAAFARMTLSATTTGSKPLYARTSTRPASQMCLYCRKHNFND